MSNNKNKISWSRPITFKAVALIGFILIGLVAWSQPVVNSVSSLTVNGHTATPTVNPPSSATYGFGATIYIDVTFSEIVNVTGTPSMILELGINDRSISYTSGTGTTILTFTYVVANGDFSSNTGASNTTRLSYVSQASLSGTIRSVLLVQADLTLPAIGLSGSLSLNKAIIIRETQLPLVSSVSSTTANGTWYQGQIISITFDFDEPVNVTGVPRLQLETGTIDQFATYASGSGNTTGTLTFNYTIQAGDVSSDLDYISTAALTLNGGTIRDQNANNATLTLATPSFAGSLGANKNIIISGIPPPTPTTQASAINFTSFTTTSLGFNWTSGNGQRRIILAKAGSAVDSQPLNGTGYTASTIFGSSTQIGTGNFVVYDGTGASSSVSNLVTNTIYHFKVFEYNGSTTSANYNTGNATNNPASHTTLVAEPTTQGNNPASSSITDNSITLTWTNGNGANRIILASEDCCFGITPIDGTTYAASSIFGTGDQVSGGAAPVYVVFNGAGTSTTITNLRPSTSYRFRIFEFNGSNGSENYRSSSTSNQPSTIAPSLPKFFLGSVNPTSISSTSSLGSAFSFKFYNSATNQTIGSVTIKQGGGNQVLDWTEIIAAADLNCLSCCNGNPTILIASNSITFTNAGGGNCFWRPSTGGSEYVLEVSFKTALTGSNPQTIDGKELDFVIDNTSIILQAGMVDPSSPSINNLIPVDVTASKLKFIQQPPAATWAGVAMLPAVTLEATDVNNNRDLDFVSAVGLTSTGTLSAAQSATFSSGVGTYSNIVHSATGTSRTLSTTNASGLTNVTSTSFSITQPLQLSPDVMTLFPRAGNTEKIVMTLTKAPNLTSGANVTGFTASTGTIASAVYTDVAGSAPFTVTLTSAANSQWTSATTITYTQGGNLVDTDGFGMNTITAHAVVIETTAPSITNVLIPDIAMKVGDVVTATITVVNDDGDDAILVAGGTIGGFPLGTLINTSATSKTLTFTIAEGGLDIAAGAIIPVSFALKDGQNNTSPTYTADIVQAGDAIDANSPKVTFINRQTTTNVWSTTGGSSAASVVFRVRFSEPINASTLSAADFALSTTGSIASAVIGAPASDTPNTDYLITVSGYTGTGTLGLNYVDNNDANAIKDLAGNSTITSIGNADGDFTGQTFSIVLPEPTNNVTAVSATAVSASQAIVNWTNAVAGQLPTHLLILAKKTGVGTYASVADGFPVTPEEDFTNNNGAAIINLISNPTQTSYTFNDMQSNTQYDFIVYSYTLSSNNSADNTDYKIGSNPIASATLSALTISSLNAVGNSVATSPLSASATSQGVFGFSMTSNALQIVSSITVHTSSSSLGILSNFSMVRSSDNIYATTGDNTLITGLTFTPSSSQVVITGLTESISSLKNYFLVGDASAGINGANSPIQFSISQADVVVNLGFVISTSIVSTNYSFISSQQSDIIFNTGTSSNIIYGNFQSASGLTTINAASLATFQIRDGGGSADVDNQNTILTNLTLQFSNYSNIRRIAIFDGTTNVAEQDVTTDIVSLSGLSLTATDNSTKLFSVRATFNTTVYDNQNIQVSVFGASAANTGSVFASTDAGGAGTSGSVNKIVVTADRLFYVSPPASVLINQNFGLTVNPVDANGNADADYAGVVTLSKFSGSGTLASSDAGGLSRSLSLGSVAWTQLQISSFGSYTIRATLSGLTLADLTLNALAPAGEPTTQVSALNFSSLSLTSVTINFINGNGSSRILVAKSGSSVDANPVDGIGYSANTIFGSGPQLGTGNYIVGVGSGPITVTGLTAGTTYFFRAFEFNGTGGTENYNISTASGNPASVSTLSLPTITSFIPASGGVGTVVTITGTNFDPAFANNMVKFNSTTATSSASTSTSITCTVPVGATSGAITVTVNGLTATSSANFTIVTPPTISSFNPMSGPVGSSVTITGTNFDTTPANNTVKFNGTTAVATASTAASITTSVPTGAATGTITVTVAGQTATSTTSFTVTIVPVPTISSFTPSGGTGSIITISGTEFTGATAVNFGGTDASSFNVVSATSITAVVGSGSSGSVSVTTPGGIATKAGFTFILGPTISSFAPTSAAAGATITIEGINFMGATVVSFGGIAALSFNVVSATSITAVVSSGASGSVSITTPEGTATKTGFTFIPAPTILSFTPAGGTGSTITITGTDFTGATAVSFGGTAATSFNVVSATSITAVVASGSSGSVSVTTPGGTATKTGFTFIIDTTPPVLVSNNTSPSITTGSALTFTVTYSDAESTVTGATVEYRVIEAGGTHTTAAMVASGNNWILTLPASTSFGELGLEYRFKATNSAGLSSSFSSYYTLQVATTSVGGLTIPFTVFGTKTTDYRIFSVPLELNNSTLGDVLGDDLGGSPDIKKWRAARYETVSKETVYLNASSPIGLGKGYWLLIKDNTVTLDTGPGKTVNTNSENAFKIDLIDGWNQIGNPYNFDVKWEDVQVANPTVGKLMVWNGSYDVGPLKKYEGGFVKVTGNVELKIPVLKSGRTTNSNNINQNPIDEIDWQVLISVKQLNMQYNLGGVGMCPKASKGFDVLDNFTPPRLNDYLEFNHNRKVGGDYYSSDIVPTEENHQWEFSIDSNLPDESVYMSWDNSYFGNGDKVLVLEDLKRNVLINMSERSAYSFPFTKDNRFRILYGSLDYVLKESLSETARILSVSPNPSDGQFTVDYAVPYGKEQPVTISILDLMGKTVGTVVNKNHAGGFYKANWETTTSEPRLAGAIYLIQLKTNNNITYQRIIIR